MGEQKRIRVGLLFGGRSPEHEISITTAASIAAEADRERLEIVPIYITREGRWLELAGSDHLSRLAGHVASERELSGLPRREVLLSGAETAALVPVSSGGAAPRPIDVLFPALHGQGGEDGSVQGLARLAGIPCVGSGILGSALGMDKISMKKVADSEGIPIPRYVGFSRGAWERDPRGIEDEIRRVLTLPVFVKPSGAGSSVGIARLSDFAGLGTAIRDAARYDYRILVEQGIDARELEVALLGNEEPEVSVVGEIIPAGEFYDYRAKYVDEGSTAVIPADVPVEISEAVRERAARIFRALDLSGLARADFLLDRRDANVYFNEVNTIPGFTPISMYPMLWQASGVGYRELITRLVDLSIERHRETRVENEAPDAFPGDEAGGE